jgi:hypothetical protein
VSEKRADANFDFDVCLSFAGEDREYVSQVADALRVRGVRVFYDGYNKASLWGKDLYEHLDYVYRLSARFCVIFISKYYADKLWTNHERRSAQSRAFSENKEYILPARFDDTEIPGILNTIGNIDLSNVSPAECAALIVEKASPYRMLEFQNRVNYFPPVPDILFTYMKLKSARKQRIVYSAGRSFFETLKLLSDDERRLVAAIFYHSCPHDKPNNAHLELGLLRRILAWDEKPILSMLSKLRPVGFRIEVEKFGPKSSPGKTVTLRWGYWSDEMERLKRFHPSSDFTDVAWAIFDVVGRHYCDVHAVETIVRLNFSSLSTATAVDDIHFSP